MRHRTNLAIGAAAILAFSAFMTGPGHSVPNTGNSYKYSVAQCNAAFARCTDWCVAHRTGEEKTKCENKCIDFYANCMGARYRGTTPPMRGQQTLPMKRSP